MSVVGTFDGQLQALWSSFIATLVEFLPSNTNLADLHRGCTDSVRQFFHHLALFISSFYKAHRDIAEKDTEATKHALLYLVALTAVNDSELFKIVADCWHGLTQELYTSEIIGFGASEPLSPAPLLGFGGGGGGNGGNGNSATKWRLTFYRPYLSLGRHQLIMKMPKPEEILIKEEDGHIVRETLQDSEVSALYVVVKATLVFMTHIDPEDTQTMMFDMLSKQMDGSQWSWKALNTLCWSIGSISGAMTEEAEKRFIINVIKNLLTLTEQKRGKDNKAVVASNIMYVVGQYPRFLRAHWRFLKTVVLKLFEFMHELHPGVC